MLIKYLLETRKRYVYSIWPVRLLLYLFFVYKRYKTQINKCLYTVQYLLSAQPNKYIEYKVYFILCILSCVMMIM